MPDKPSRKDRLEHMVEVIGRVFRFSSEMDFELFSANEMAQFAIIKNFEFIGEAVYQLPKEYRDANDSIEWRKIMAFRPILVHDYYKINLEIVWNAIQDKLEDLKIRIIELMCEI